MGMSDFRSTGARASFEPHHGEIRQAGASLIKPTETVGRQFASQPLGSLNATNSSHRLGGFSIRL